MTEDKNFWSRRRAGVAAELEAETAKLDAEALAQEHAELEQKTDAEILSDLDLPDPDSLKMGDDFSAFMSKAVPDRLRRRALRTLWRSNPVLANVDMLVDYGEDFTDAALVVENMQTAYQVGKGMLKHVEEMARQAELREAAMEEDAAKAADEDQDAAPDASTDQDEHDQDGDLNPDETLIMADAVRAGADNQADIDLALADPHQDPAFAAPTPRRMKFRTEGHAA